jgi:FtsH-binding integral membrane protein
MENYDLRYGEDRYSVAAAPANERVVFLKRTYGHLLGAVLGFIVLEALLLQLGMDRLVFNAVRSLPYGYFLLIAAFIGAGYMAQAMAQSATSNAARYAGLALYVALEAVIFLPLMAIAMEMDPNLPLQAGIITAAAFAGLTFGVAASGKDFSFLGPILWVASLVALGVVVCAILFGGGGLLGIFFSGAMILLAAGYIVYDTSNVMHHYRSDQYVAAALALFASVTMLLWYIIRLLMSMRD